jgi:alpha-L-fucosidase
MRLLYPFLAAALACAQPASAPLARTTHPDAQWFGNAGLGLFLHWGISSVDGRGDISWFMMKDTPWDKGALKLTPEQYWALADRFNPTMYDPDKWLGAARRAGFRYAVMITRHHDGYALWPSAYGDFSTRTKMSGRDLVKPFVEACRRNGLKVGLYYSPPDWHFNRDHMSFRFRDKDTDPSLPDLGTRHQPINLRRTASDLRGGDSFQTETRGTDAEWQQKFRAYVKGQVEELLTRYGKIDLIWFDGGPAAISVERIRELQPGIVINPRMHGHGDYTTPEVNFPKTQPEGWWELCAIWNRAWGYTSDEEYKPLATVLAEFVRVRAWGGNYLINMGPRPTGELPPAAYQRMAELEAWMKHSGESVTGTEPAGWPEMSNVPATRKGGTVYLHALPGFTAPLELKESARPAAVTLLRTGRQLAFRHENGTVRVEIPTAERTALVDVVAVSYR